MSSRHTECATPVSYHATPTSAEWWLYDDSTSACPSPALDYKGTALDARYPHSASPSYRIHPYSPAFSPMQSRLGPIFLENNAMALAASQRQRKQPHWTSNVRCEPQVYEPPSVLASPGWPILPLDSTTTSTFDWSELMLLDADPSAVGTASPSSSVYSLPSPFDPFRTPLLTCSSPALSTSSSQTSPRSTSSALPNTSPRTPRRPSASSKTCSHCAATSTPLWRRDPTTHKPLCNACGLYLQQRNKMRPPALIAADQRGDEEEDRGAKGEDAGPSCSHCGTHRTSVWRRSKTGARVCNACGVYARLRGRDRPLSLRRNKIRPRCKHPK